MDMNIELIKNAIPLLIAGAGITVEITALSVFFGMLIGIIVALARLSDFKILRWLGNVYVVRFYAGWAMCMWILSGARRF